MESTLKMGQLPWLLVAETIRCLDGVARIFDPTYGKRDEESQRPRRCGLLPPRCYDTMSLVAMVFMDFAGTLSALHSRSMMSRVEPSSHLSHRQSSSCRN